jgi:hypothetical protein
MTGMVEVTDAPINPNTLIYLCNTTEAGAFGNKALRGFASKKKRGMALYVAGYLCHGTVFF